MEKMRVPTNPILLLCAFAMLLPALPSRGGDAGGYLRLDGGFNLAEDVAVDIAGNSGKLELKSGFRVDLAVGYDLNRWAAVEFEAGYAYNSAESLTVLNQSPDLHDTWLRSVPLMGNLILHYQNRSDFVPYIGAGAGGIFSTLSLYSNEDTDMVFAYQFKAGIIYKIDARAWIDIGYKYLASDDQKYDIGTVPIKARDTHFHFIGASVIWRW